MPAPSLEEEYGKALALHDRALFFAESVPKNDALAKELASFGFQHAGAIVSNQATLKLLKHINIIYGVSGRLLMLRLKTVSNQYLYLHRPFFIDRHRVLRKLFGEIRWPDRNPIAIKDSRKIVADRFKALVRGVNLDLDAEPPLSINILIENCRSRWIGTNNICRLFMDEITHTSNRVDYANGVLITKRSLLLAALGIIVSIGLAIISPIFSKGSDAGDLTKSAATIANSSVLIQKTLQSDSQSVFPSIHRDLATIATNSAPLTQAIGISVDNSNRIRAVIEAANQGFLPDIHKDLQTIGTNVLEAKGHDNSPDELKTVETLQASIADLQTRILILEMDNKTHPTALSDLEKVVSQLKSLNVNLEELRKTIVKQKPTQINKKSVISIE